jgi:hypothetical protein
MSKEEVLTRIIEGLSDAQTLSEREEYVENPTDFLLTTVVYLLGEIYLLLHEQTQKD